jgi:exodeoxyribonuclease V gamma subunit
VARLPALDAGAEARRAHALEQLRILVDLFDRGMREPLPIACRSSAAYAIAAHEGRDPEQAARDAWESGWQFDKEDKELEHQLVLGGVRSLAELLDEEPREDEAGDGWDLAEGSRFGRLARRLWAGALAREEVSDR